jgi:cytochrome bd-type quinol oxidase subunit 2
MEPEGHPATPPTPRWVWLTLLAGTLALMVWGWVLTLFHAESSVVEAALTAWSVLSTLAALSGIAALFNLLIFRDDRRRRSLAAAAAIMMTTTVVGAVVGVPILRAIYSRPKTPTN